MRNIKFISVFAAFGFLLSFVFGVCSHTPFLSVILKAFLFAVIFAALGFGISFLATKFLMDENSSEISNDFIQQPVVKSNSKGNIVDITIRDEELPQSISENHFNVGDNHQMLNESDIGKLKTTDVIKQTSNEDTDKNVSFAPIRNVETVENVSTKEAIKPTDIADNGGQNIENKSNQYDNPFNSEKEIDTLPDMAGFSIERANNSDDSSEEDDEDDDSSGFVASPVRSTRSENEVPEIKDASLYAKAISSILSGEKD